MPSDVSFHIIIFMQKRHFIQSMKCLFLSFIFFIYIF
nr:MAG TPA: hypothetical protein [Caudoviricetes sp.]